MAHDKGPKGAGLNLDPDEGDVFTDGEFYFAIAEDQSARAPTDATWKLRPSPDRHRVDVVSAPPPCARDRALVDRVDGSCYRGKKDLELSAEIDTPGHRHLVFYFGNHKRTNVDASIFRRIFSSIRFK